MEKLHLKKIEKIAGTVQMPGSKSISNRILLLAALAQGQTKITNLLDSDDVRLMLKALQDLGVSIELSKDKTSCIVQGCAGQLPCRDGLSLFLGNSGTTMRFLTAVLCGFGEFPAEIILTGEPRMYQRPIEHLVTALKQAGAEIDYLENFGYPPVVCKNKGIIGGIIEVDGSISSQFLTALLLSAPLATQGLEINVKGDLVSKPYIEITIQMMADFGVKVINHNYQKFIIPAGQKYISPTNYRVENDASSASYFLAAGAISGAIRVEGISQKSLQGDKMFAEILQKMGAKVTWGDDFIEVREGDLKAIDCDLNHIPDVAMTMAVLALFAKGETIIRNIYNWRVKETDRLKAMATELAKLGAKVVEGEDFIKVTGLDKENFKFAEIETYNDHRIAMCFALVAFAKEITILDPHCTSKTFPEFFEIFTKLTNR